MSQIKLVKDQLRSQGVNHYVIFDEVGNIDEFNGDFENVEKQLLARTTLQQASRLLSPNEKLKRITMNMQDVVYVATVVNDGDKQFGVVTKRILSNTPVKEEVSK